MAALVWAVFAQTCAYDFVTYDDNLYVYDNANVSHGFSSGTLRYAFTETCAANWHPLTMLLHTLNAQSFGLQAGGHHAVNVLLHTTGVILLFLALLQLTGQRWLSAFAAALFAIHPLRVESVAWISELKDVLSGVFFFLGLIAYAAYLRRPNRGRYLALVIVFALGLLSKPMLVTFPLALLLLDWWPLRRLTAATIATVIREKIPLILLSIIAAVITFFVQSSKGAGHAFPFPARMGNAILSYAIYLRQFIWPFDLIVFYPHPGSTISSGAVLLSGLCLIAITALAILLRKHAPYLLMGWIWYLVLLLPVIGLVQVGVQSHADRYTYLPQLGIYFALVWGAAGLARWLRISTRLTAAIACAVVVVFAFCAWRQAGYWKNGETLWQHAVDVTPQSDTAHWGLAKFYLDHDNIDAGLMQCRAALEIEPKNVDAHIGAGAALEKKGDTSGAIEHWQAALEINPANIKLRNRLGAALARVHRVHDALEQWNLVIKNDPEDANARNNVAWILATAPDPALHDGHRAVELAGEAVRLGGENAAVLRTLAAAYAENQQFDLAVQTIGRAIQEAESKGQPGLLQNLRGLDALLRAGNPYRDPSLADTQ